MNTLAKCLTNRHIHPERSLLDSFFNEPLLGQSCLSSTAEFDVDVYEESGQWKIEAALPGVKREEISIEIDDGILEIKTEKKSNKRKDNTNYVVHELSYSNVSRSFKVPRGTDNDSIVASLKDGILTIEFSKPEKNRIEIK